jgi:hypothetical protein
VFIRVLVNRSATAIIRCLLLLFGVVARIPKPLDAVWFTKCNVKDNSNGYTRLLAVKVLIVRYQFLV